MGLFGAPLPEAGAGETMGAALVPSGRCAPGTGRVASVGCAPVYATVAS